jgi:hypothetical protein
MVFWTGEVRKAIGKVSKMQSPKEEKDQVL